MKVKNQKATVRDEFRRNKINQHPAYIYKKVGNDYEYIGITHSEITEGTKNIRLDKNPDPTDKKTAFVRTRTEKDKTNNFKSKEKCWKLSKPDKQKINKIKK